MQIGIASFVDTDPTAGAAGAAQRLRELVEQAELAEQVGLEVVAVGEHHRPDFAVSSPAVVLAAVAARTERVRLSSAVTVLSSDDPVRVYQDFATLDLLSGGRAEIMAGRGSFTESFPLFGQNLDDYDELFAEGLELLLAVRDSERVTWAGRHRAALTDEGERGDRVALHCRAHPLLAVHRLGVQVDRREAEPSATSCSRRSRSRACIAVIHSARARRAPRGRCPRTSRGRLSEHVRGGEPQRSSLPQSRQRPPTMPAPADQRGANSPAQTGQTVVDAAQTPSQAPDSRSSRVALRPSSPHSCTSQSCSTRSIVMASPPS